MTRLLLAPIISVLLVSVAFAQLPPVSLTLDPATESKPSLRFALLPTGRERVTGNAALHYANAVLARPAIDKAKVPEEEKKLAMWEDSPLDQLPVDDLKAHLKAYATTFRELDHGARCKSCEWHTAPASGPVALDQTIASQQMYRDLARLLALRVKLDLAEHRYDDAIAGIRTGLQLAKHVGEGPSLIQLLVGHALAGVFLKRAEDFSTSPGSPSLYWALSTLPRPLIDPRPSLDGEDELIEGFLPGLADVRKGPVSNEKAIEVAETVLKVFAAADGENRFLAFGGRFAITGHATLYHEAARKELIARGWEKKNVNAMPAVQAVFLSSFDAYQEIADDHRKWFLTPLPESFEGLARSSSRLKKAQKDKQDDTMFQTFLLALPAVERVHHAAARTERKIAAMRAVEAIRIHTAAAVGLPKELADIKKVPVAPDPLTGQPFEYVTTTDGFTLRSPASDIVPKSLTLGYEVKVRR